AHARTVSIPDNKIQKARLRVPRNFQSKQPENGLFSKPSVRFGTCCLAEFTRHASSFDNVALTAATSLGSCTSSRTDTSAACEPACLASFQLHTFTCTWTRAMLVCPRPSNKELHAYPLRRGKNVWIASTNTSEFSINVRELLAIVTAVSLWADRWRHLYDTTNTLHIRCWLDNAAAVSSRNHMAQEFHRRLGALEATFTLRVSAQHLSRASIFLADLRSRELDQVSETTPQLFHWQSCYASNMPAAGSRGADGAHPTDAQGGFQLTKKSNPFNTLYLPHTAGEARCRHVTTPFDVNSATSAGNIVPTLASNPSSAPVTSCFSAECVPAPHHLELENQAPLQFCDSSESGPTSPSPATVSSMGLRCWAFSSCSNDPSI
ncbi:TPA: hypothetical protein N0F65_008262, partial [Lagenidium giganteum]